jgi:hypothetical protein
MEMGAERIVEKAHLRVLLGKRLISSGVPRSSYLFHNDADNARIIAIDKPKTLDAIYLLDFI